MFLSRLAMAAQGGGCILRPAAFVLRPRTNGADGMRYSGLRVITEGLFGNKGWTPAWREPAPKAEYDAIIIGGPVTSKAAGSASFTSLGSGAGGIRLAAPVQTPLGSQAYAGAVSLVTNAALTAGSGISFGGTVDGRRSLAVRGSVRHGTA